MDAIKNFSLIKVMHMSLCVCYLLCEEKIHLLFVNMYQLTIGRTWWLLIAKFGCQVVHNHYVFKNLFAFIAKYGRMKEYCHVNNDLTYFKTLGFIPCKGFQHYEISHQSKPHNLATKTQKTIHITIVQLSFKNTVC